MNTPPQRRAKENLSAPYTPVRLTKCIRASALPATKNAINYEDPATSALPLWNPAKKTTAYTLKTLPVYRQVPCSDVNPDFNLIQFSDNEWTLKCEKKTVSVKNDHPNLFISYLTNKLRHAFIPIAISIAILHVRRIIEI